VDGWFDIKLLRANNDAKFVEVDALTGHTRKYSNTEGHCIPIADDGSKTSPIVLD
jgi:hypothetical protein